MNMPFPIHATPDTVRLEHPIICIGNFDGVHLGHQMLLARMRELSKTRNAPTLIISFFPTARMIFQKSKCLSTAEEKARLLAAFAPDAVVIIPFSLEYAQTDKQVFLQQLARLEPSAIIVGEDFRFGHQRSGNLNDLSTISNKLEIFNLKNLGDTPIKSSYIRQRMQEHKLSEVKTFLGYDYFCLGTVIHGDKRGRTIGYPTANIQLSPDKLLPEGVFAVRCQVAGERYQGMANVGARPSFVAGAPALEVHLFDMDKDIYDEEMRVEFIEFLRVQQKFSGLTELKAQLAEDERMARHALASTMQSASSVHGLP